MKLQVIDAHTHVHFAAYEKDSSEVIARALDQGIGMILVGTQYDTSVGGMKVAKQYKEGVYATIGLHPIHTEASHHDAKELGGGDAAKAFTSRGENFDYDAYVELAIQEKIVGIGECGLDYYRLHESTKNKQQKIFEEHIRLSREVGKPLMIHCRDAFSDLIAILRKNRTLLLENPGVIHFFTGTPDDTKNLLELGFSFTFGGVITFARDYDEAIHLIPVDRILCETDAPYVAPLPYRGKRNEPAYIVETVKKLAELKDVSYEQMAGQTLENTRRIFKI